MFQPYRRTGVIELRPHVVGENMEGISVSPEDQSSLAEPGGMIARNPNNPADQWYVNATYFAANYELLGG